MTDSRPRKRLVLCMGVNCNRADQAQPLYDRLQQAFGDPMPGFMAKGPVRWEFATCLDHCGTGPNLIVYPDQTVYHALNLETLEELLETLTGEAPARP